MIFIIYYLVVMLSLSKVPNILLHTCGSEFEIRPLRNLLLCGCVMESRVLDPRLGGLPPDASVDVVDKAVLAVFKDLHPSMQAKRWDKTLSSNAFDTIGALMTLTMADLLDLGVPQGHAKLTLRALFPPSLQPSQAPSTPVPQVAPDSPYAPSPSRKSGPEFCGQCWDIG